MVESVAFASVVLAVWSVPAASIAQTLTAEVRGAGDDADAAALRTQVSRAEGDLTGCMGTSARGRSETVLWLSVAATGEVTVALALHRGPAEGVGQCLVERMRSWRLHAGARRRIELVLRTGHEGGPTPAAPSARAVTPTRPPPPAPAVTPTRSTPPAPAAPPSRPPTTPPAARTPAPALPPSPAPAVP
ncbi:MAG: hypothetical protein IT379_12625, partial [Deltaproteobacteria bacterium]|nr:hypothetical protein [Deltaproteobacteria bacterium]